MRDLFKDDEIEAVLSIDTENTFNSVNREVMLHNISIMCSIISTFILDCYCVPARLFVIGNKEIISRKGMTQGVPTVRGFMLFKLRCCFIFTRIYHVQ